MRPTCRQGRAPLIGYLTLLVSLTFAIGSASSLLSACSEAECAAGATRACSGDNSCAGSQVCVDGNWQTCGCAAPLEPSGSTSSGSDGTNDFSTGVAPSTESSSLTSVPTAQTTSTAEATSVAQSSSAPAVVAPGAVPPSDACRSYTASQTSGFSLPIIYRDFIGADQGGHADFETFAAAEVLPGIVDVNLSQLGPRFIGQPGRGITNAESFESWFNDDTSFNIHINDTLNVTASQDSFVYATDRFFPIDDKAQVALERETKRPNEECGGNADEFHNFSFTSELRLWFDYTGDEELTFEGNDDVWIFINNRLVVDFGGVHEVVATDPPLVLGEAMDTSGKALSLQTGQRYELAIFHAERRSCDSSYSLVLKRFAVVSPNCK